MGQWQPRSAGSGTHTGAEGGDPAVPVGMAWVSASKLRQKRGEVTRLGTQVGKGAWSQGPGLAAVPPGGRGRA